MAGHLEVATFQNGEVIYNSFCNGAIKKAINSIFNRVNYYKQYINHSLVNDLNLVYGKPFVRLPSEYTDEDHIPFNVGEYNVGKRIVHGGKAIFELHYSKSHSVLYSVA